MKIKNKILILLTVASISFLGSILLLIHSQDKKLDLIINQRRVEKQKLCDEIIKMKGEKLNAIVNRKYSLWDEMVAYIENVSSSKADKKFEIEKLNPLLTQHNFAGVWVLDSRFKNIYSSTSRSLLGLHELPLTQSQLAEMFAGPGAQGPVTDVHFFAQTLTGLLELRGSSVHSSDDTQKEQTAVGYFFAGYLWDNEFVKEAEQLNSAELAILEVTENARTSRENNRGDETNSFIAKKSLVGWDGSPVADLIIKFPVSEDTKIKSAGYQDILLITVLSAVLLCVFLFLLVLWIVKPLALISSSLKNENPDAIQALTRTNNEFGEISQLINNFFTQKTKISKEIEERKSATRELEIKSAFLDQLIENAPEAVVVLDNSDHVLRINGEFTRLYGFEAHEAVGHNLNSLIVPEEMSLEASTASHNVSTGHHASFESVRRRKDGSLVHVSILGAPVHIEGGQVGVFGIYRDISERKEMEVKLEKSERYYRSLIENSVDVVLVVKPDGVVSYSSPSLDTTLSMSPNEMVGKNALTIIHPDDHFKAKTVLKAMVTSPGTGQAIELRLMHKDRTWRHFQIKGVCVEGDEPYLVVNAVDITERKRSEDRIRQLSAAIEQSPISIVITDTQGRMEYVNPWFTQITGYSPLEAIGCKPAILDLEKDLNSESEKLWEIISAGGTWRGEYQNKKKNGELYWESATISPIKAADGVIRNFVVVRDDITDRKNSEKALIAAREDAEAAMRAKSDFLATMSHEIRTPMNGVIGMTELLLDTNLTAEQRDFVNTIQVSGDSLLSVINDILDYSKIESGKMELEKNPLSLIGCIESTLDIFSKKAAEKNIELIYSIDDNVPDALIGDETRVKQVLMNLTNNALKFTDEGEVLITVENNSAQNDKTVRDDIELLIRVKDTGIGIASDKIDRLFKSFSQVDSCTTRKYGGTGLGLAIVDRLVRLMGGSVWVDSNEGIGSTFCFTIQVGVNNDDQAAANINLSDLKNKRVLIVDDNETNLQILSVQCARMGMIPTVATGPFEALEWLGHGQVFDIGIIDMHMPKMDGLELGVAIREIRSMEFLPLVMLSSLGNKAKPANYPSNVYSSFLSKPIKQAQLRDVMLHIFAGSKNGKEAFQSKIDAQLSDRIPLQILLAEDNAINQKLAVLAFEKMGYKVDIANNGLKVLEALRNKKFDIIFMDVQMPEMDGLEATRRIVSQFSGKQRPRIIAMTANAMKEDRDQCMAAGMDDFITKPINIKQIQSKLIEWGGTMTPEIPNPMPTSKIIDIEQLKDIGVTPDFFKELADMYVDQAQTLIGEIKDYAHVGELTGFRKIAHSLKGISANMGAVAMVEACLSLEKIEAHHRPKEINVLIHRLGIVYEETRFQLRQLILENHFLEPVEAA